LLAEVDSAIEFFTGELKSQGIWLNVTIITASEFARTLTSNGLGTDHGWSGNHLMGGEAASKGKKSLSNSLTTLQKTAL
jgi:uncharacterized protein (DUF1501 family)